MAFVDKLLGLEAFVDSGMYGKEAGQQRLAEIAKDHESAPPAEIAAAAPVYSRINSKLNAIFSGGERGQDIRNVDDATERLDELWEKMSTNFFATVNSPQITEVSQAAKEMREVAKKFLSPEEQEMMELCFRMRDAVYQQSGEDMNTFLAWSDTNPASKARVEARKLLSGGDLKKFRRVVISHFDTAGVEHRVDMGEVFDFIEEVFNGPFIYDHGPPAREYNYAAMGNPDDDAKARGVPTVRDLVERDPRFIDILNLPSFVRESINNFIIASEMRNNFYIPEYAGYQGSPIPGFDGGPSEDAAPLAAVTYKAQSGTSFPKHRALAVITRFPDPADPRWVRYSPGRVGARTYNFRSEKPDFVGKYHTESYGMIEATVGRNKVPDNIDTWVKVRSRLIADMTAKSMPWVRLRPDLKIKPTWYDWIRGEWEGSGRPLETLTYHNFLVTEVAFKKFEEYVDAEYRAPKDLHEVDTLIGNLVEKIRDFKLLFDKMSDDEDLFLNIVQLMSILYLKKVYTAFKRLLAKSKQQRGFNRFLTKSGFQSDLAQFVEICEPLIIKAGTLPNLVKTWGAFPLETVFHELSSGRINAAFGTDWASFFEDSSERMEEATALESEKTFDPPFKRTYENWMREPSIKEKEAH